MSLYVFVLYPAEMKQTVSADVKYLFTFVFDVRTLSAYQNFLDVSHSHCHANTNHVHCSDRSWGIHIWTRGCGRWGAARYGAVLAVEYVCAVLGLSRSVQGGKVSLRHLPNIKLIGQQAAKLWGFFANNAISRHDFDLWPLDLEIGPRGASVRGTLPTKFSIRRPFRFPSRWRHGTDRQTDRRTDRINTWRGLLLGRTAPYKSSQTYSIGLTCLVASVDAMQLVC